MTTSPTYMHSHTHTYTTLTPGPLLQWYCCMLINSRGFGGKRCALSVWCRAVTWPKALLLRDGLATQEGRWDDRISDVNMMGTTAKVKTKVYQAALPHSSHDSILSYRTAWKTSFHEHCKSCFVWTTNCKHFLKNHLIFWTGRRRSFNNLGPCITRLKWRDGSGQRDDWTNEKKWVMKTIYYKYNH